MCEALLGDILLATKLFDALGNLVSHFRLFHAVSLMVVVISVYAIRNNLSIECIDKGWGQVAMSQKPMWQCSGANKVVLYSTSVVEACFIFFAAISIIGAVKQTVGSSSGWGYREDSLALLWGMVVLFCAMSFVGLVNILSMKNSYLRIYADHIEFFAAPTLQKILFGGGAYSGAAMRLEKGDVIGSSVGRQLVIQSTSGSYNIWVPFLPDAHQAVQQFITG